jgi:hypothetical protein
LKLDQRVVNVRSESAGGTTFPERVSSESGDETSKLAELLQQLV